MVFGKDKIVGTFVPVFSLRSKKISAEDQGTFDAGIPFIQWLKKTNQHGWQILPLSETQLEQGSRKKHVPSPYKGYGIGLDPKYLSSKYKKLRPTQVQLQAFLQKHNSWIYTYALFCVLRDRFGTDDWREWDADLRDRKPEVLARWEKELADEIQFYLVQQWQLHASYDAMHLAAKENDILLIGDLPFYLSLNSPLVWSNRDLFQIEKDGSLAYVSGAATRGNSHFGRQVWGHPLYDWSQREKLLNFWKMRLLYRSHLYDVMRFDYAIGFLIYAAKNISDPSKDLTMEGPGAEFLGELINYSHEKGLRVFVEDSGNPIQVLRDFIYKAHISGIRIFRFAYDEKIDKIIEYYAAVKNYAESSVVYTTTHDTEPLLGYLALLTREEKLLLAEKSGITFDSDDNNLAKNMRNAVIHSPSKTVIIQLQDWLLTRERINIPGTEKAINDSNWSFKIPLHIEDLPSTVY